MARDGCPGRAVGSRQDATGRWVSRGGSARAATPRVRLRSPARAPDRARQLRERHVDVGARLRRESQDTLADDVALDLVGTTADGDRRAREEQRLPLVAAVDSGDAVRTEDVEGESRGGLEPGAAPQLRPRTLWSWPAPRPGGVTSPARGKPRHLELDDRRRQPLAHEHVGAHAPPSDEVDQSVLQVGAPPPAADRPGTTLMGERGAGDTPPC